MLFRWLLGSLLLVAVVGSVFGFFTHRVGIKGAFWVGLAATFALLWGGAGRLARFLARPLDELSDVARGLGQGGAAGYRVSTQLVQHPVAEVRQLAATLTDMGERIEQQLSDQRELLAAVSHELRSPLGRVRVLLELAREARDPTALDAIEAEVVTCDRLIGTMLATARLDFSALSPAPVDPHALARRALQRASLDEDKLLDRVPVDPSSQGAMLVADATLLQQALANLLDNAARHGEGVEALGLSLEGGEVVFWVDDSGPGFASGESERVFASFHREQAGQAEGLGLGLSLVQRIAHAHGGRAWAENRAAGGARVAFSVPCGPSQPVGNGP